MFSMGIEKNHCHEIRKRSIFKLFFIDSFFYEMSFSQYKKYISKAWHNI